MERTKEDISRLKEDMTELEHELKEVVDEITRKWEKTQDDLKPEEPKGV